MSHFKHIKGEFGIKLSRYTNQFRFVRNQFSIIGIIRYNQKGYTSPRLYASTVPDDRYNRYNLVYLYRQTRLKVGIKV